MKQKNIKVLNRKFVYIFYLILDWDLFILESISILFSINKAVLKYRNLHILKLEVNSSIIFHLLINFIKNYHKLLKFDLTFDLA